MKDLMQSTGLEIDYRKFNLLFSNREVDWKHVDDLADSIKDNGWLGGHVLINERYQVLDGQHRFYALRKLGMPIPFEMKEGLTTNDIVTLNNKQKSWSTTDYINRWAKEGLHDYQFILDQYNKYNKGKDKLSLTIIIEAFSPDIGSPYGKIRNGSYVLGDKSRGLKILNSLMRISQGMATDHAKKAWKKSGFTTAMIFLMKLEGFSMNRFIHAVTFYQHKFGPTGNHSFFKVMLRELYNNGLSPKNEI